MKLRQGQAGFSLAELMVVIGLLAILSAIAAPSFLRSLPEQRLKNAARTLYADIQRARMLAANDNRKVSVRFNHSIRPGYYYFDDNRNGKWDPGEFRRNLSDYPGIDFGKGKAEKKWDGSTINSLFTHITFGRTGTTNNQGSTLLHNQNEDICYAVTTASYGFVKIRRFDGKEWDQK